MTAATEELLQLSQSLLDSITTGDWETYERLCDPSLTAFEPEARGHQIEGMAFHRFYFDREPRNPRPQNSICSPTVRLLGDDAAVVTYVRLIQWVDDSGASHTEQFEETRVWQRQAGSWRHVHFHRSANR
jgi:calcium/calmodulin-dependent protein kinase (CaM kinase) II